MHSLRSADWSNALKFSSRRCAHCNEVRCAWIVKNRDGNAVFKACFVDCKNIASIQVLTELASSVELPADEAAEILATGAFKAAVDADWALSQERSITAVPTLVLNQDRVVGAQPYEALEGLMEANGIKKRALYGC